MCRLTASTLTVAVVAALAAGIAGPSSYAYASPFVIPVDESASSVTVQICIPGGCDSDVSGVSGFSVISLDQPVVPTLIELYDFDFNLTDQIDIDIDLGFILGRLTVTGQNLRLLYAQPGTPSGPVAIESDVFSFIDVPTDSEGTVTYDATMTICAAIAGAGLPCSDTRDLAEQGTQPSEMSGTIVIDNGVATVTLNPDVEIPLDPASPELGTLYITGTIVGSAEVPNPVAIPATSEVGLVLMVLSLLVLATVAFRRRPGLFGQSNII